MSDQGPKVLSRLLREHDLSPDKWVPLFHNEGITTKEHITAYKGSDELFESLLSRAYTDKERKGLRMLLEMREIPTNLNFEIERELVKAKLEPARWLSIFKTQLGVRTLQGLQQIGSESYVDLKKFADKSWEKKALRKLFGMEDEETAIKSLRKNQLQKLQQRDQKSRQIMKELKDLQRQGKGYHDEKVKHLMDGVQEVLQIPEGLWIINSSLEALLSGLKMNFDQLYDELKKSMELSDVEILECASGGHALQGVLVTRNPEDQLENREYLLRVPQDVQLKAPILCRDEKTKEFFSQYQENRFTKSMDKLGYTATASAKADLLGFGAEQKMTKDPQIGLYCSTIRYFFIPMASFHFKGSQLQLSTDALRDLQAIETFHGSKTALQKKIEQFFHKYGSHANRGHLHFGGVYWLKCYSYGFHESDIAKVKKLQNQAVSASVGLSYGGFGCSVIGEVSKLKAWFKGDFSEALMARTFIELFKKGGPHPTSNIPLWIRGLVASNSTWNVIDCGNNRVPVWEIIQVQLPCIGRYI